MSTDRLHVSAFFYKAIFRSGKGDHWEKRPKHVVCLSTSTNKSVVFDLTTWYHWYSLLYFTHNGDEPIKDYCRRRVYCKLGTGFFDLLSFPGKWQLRVSISTRRPGLPFWNSEPLDRPWRHFLRTSYHCNTPSVVLTNSPQWVLTRWQTSKRCHFQIALFSRYPQERGVL